MRSSFGRLAYVGLIVGALLFGSVFRVLGSTDATVFQSCLTKGGTLSLVTTQSATLNCPAGTTLVSWNQQGQPGPAGGLNAVQEITSSTNFTVPAGISRLMVEAWGGGGGGSDALAFPDCVSSAAGGSGGYFRTVLSVTPGETLQIVVGSGGAPGAAGGGSAVKRGGTTLVSAGGGGGGSIVPAPNAATVGGAGGQAVIPGGISRNGNPGGGGQFDFMCAMGPGNPPFTVPGSPGAAVQGSVALLSSSSAGGQGASPINNFVTQPGGAGDVILSW